MLALLSRQRRLSSSSRVASFPSVVVSDRLLSFETLIACRNDPRGGADRSGKGGEVTDADSPHTALTAVVVGGTVVVSLEVVVAIDLGVTSLAEGCGHGIELRLCTDRMDVRGCSERPAWISSLLSPALLFLERVVFAFEARVTPDVNVPADVFVVANSAAVVV